MENEKTISKRPKKLNYKQVILISLGFFTTSAAWGIYNTNVNRALDDLIGNVAIVGFLMTIDNIVGIIIQPIIGSLSDRTKTRFGRRMPYLMIGIPLAAFFFVLIPFVETNLIGLLIVIFLFNIAMAFYRSPTVALMPDFVPPEHRTKGNGIVNMIGGVGSVFAFLVGGILLDINPILAYAVVAGIMIVALIVLFFTIKEPDTRNWDFTDQKHKEKISLINSIKDVAQEKDKATLYMLLAIFFWFVAYQGIEALWSIYGIDYYGLTQGGATFALTLVALPFLVVAIPAGILATKITRKKTIMIGIVIGTALLIIIHFMQTMLWIYILFVGFGICWAMINVNSIAIVWELAPTAKHIGTYTGLYYFFSFLAAIVGPTIVGILTEYIFGFRQLFLVCSFFFALSFIFMMLVKRGEPVFSDEEKELRRQAIIEAQAEKE